MILRDHDTEYRKLLEFVAENGVGGMTEAFSRLLNEAMLIQRQDYLNAQPYERTDERKDLANGFKSRTITTRAGSVKVNIPQVRNGGFYPSSLEKGERSERALMLTLAEMYIQGVSTRKVRAVMEQLCGTSVSSTQVSRATALLDEDLQKWRERELEHTYPYVFFDARYESIRQDGRVVDMSVLIASGIRSDGIREIIGVSVSCSEAEIHWRTFFESLQKRGLKGVKLIISDAHSGLKAARKTVFPGIPWQRCQFHLQQNAQAYVTTKSRREEVAKAIRKIFDCDTKTDAEARLKETVETYAKSMPELAKWMEENLPEGFTVFDFPENIRKKLRTSNLLERVNQELKRRSKVVGIFPNPESCLRLMSALLIEISEGWLTGKKYLNDEKDSS